MAVGIYTGMVSLRVHFPLLILLFERPIYTICTKQNITIVKILRILQIDLNMILTRFDTTVTSIVALILLHWHLFPAQGDLVRRSIMATRHTWKYCFTKPVSFTEKRAEKENESIRLGSVWFIVAVLIKSHLADLCQKHSSKLLPSRMAVASIANVIEGNCV